MPDFATPAGVYSLAHTQLAAAVHDPANDPSVRLLAIVWSARRGALRFVAVDAVAAPIRVQPDRWWGRISRHIVVLCPPNARSFQHAGR